MERTAILWFRRDLRLADNPALTAATQRAGRVIPLFVLEDGGPDAWPPGSAARWWLHHSLAALDAALRRHGSRLILRRGNALDIVTEIVRQTNAQAIYWNDRIDRAGHAVDARLKSLLTAEGIAVESFNASLLFEPGTITTRSGGPFRVYTPFRKACLAMPAPAASLPVPRSLRDARIWPPSDDLRQWELLPTRPDWSGGLRRTWKPGEAAAVGRLAAFLDDRVEQYAVARDRPDREGTSRLSPHLAWGEIGPRQIWHAARHAEQSHARHRSMAIEKFLGELLWREFAHHMLRRHENLPKANYRPEFDAFPWRTNREALRAWQRGDTGFPIVDAGMRQLWRTGWMHNRVRMIVGSFLVKNLLLHWRHGEDWFWDTLVDADLANNAFNWQWIAGSGADAAPYFRIFNPVLQGQRFDPDGAYVRAFVPELAGLPNALIHKPWTADEASLAAAGVCLGRTYAAPIVDPAASRQRALDAFATIRRSAT